ncbi:MAG: ATP-dependent helicase HepA [Lentisphaeria bacterium]|jgi:ATP-dependent helicase HepA
MNDFIRGQRWVVDSEPELGLGVVTNVEGRTVQIFFEQGGCERLYAIAQAPLTRIQYAVDDEIQLASGEQTIIRGVHNQEGLLIYDTHAGHIVPETALPSEISLNQPFLRLMTGQLDKPQWFYFKRQLNAAVSRSWQSRLNGLLGIRANLIPHQLYVAWSACEREDVRVLLADEVGLGKTIEAGMILSRLLKLERVQRTLILVPDALQVQWLVELARRFSLRADLYASEEHDFHSGQIHIVAHSALAANQSHILEGEFDLVIIDEAHHLLPGSEDFSCIERLSAETRHLVLLTATPEQLGIESHFARLQLLDPAKFSSLEDFKDQEEKYVSLNQRIKHMDTERDAIAADYQLDVQADDSDEQVIDQMLDYHGIGRVMFRNVRSAIAGFPIRIAEPHILEHDGWPDKFEWLATWLKGHSKEKILVICHDIQHVYDCEQYLWKKHGIDSAVFHEEQSLIERDRAAAYFSDMESGSTLLICSEIGSEGRNFQFCAHLICLDLPDHPDLLEQRIGRLDRIGQTRDVHIHIPFAAQSRSETQFQWFHTILECIEQQNPAASAVHDQYWPQILVEANAQDDADATIDLESSALVPIAKSRLLQLREEIKQGRDALLEMNSCRQPKANELAQAIENFETDTPLALIELASELLNFHFEESHGGAYSLIPSDNMLIPALPGVPPEGCEIAFTRELANHREDLTFVTWDAPLIQGLWELLHHSEIGSASLATLTSRQLPAGHCLLETCFDIVIQSEYSVASRPFLDTHSVRSLVLDISDKDLSHLMPEESLQQSLKKVEKHLSRQIIKSKKDEIPQWYKKSEGFAEAQKLKILETARKSAESFFNHEIERLERLLKRNPSVDQREITSLKEKSVHIQQALIKNTHLQLSAIRLIVITEPN